MPDFNPLDKIRALLQNPDLSQDALEGIYRVLADTYADVTGESMENPATRDRYHKSLAGLEIIQDMLGQSADLPKVYRSFLQSGGIPDESPAMIMRQNVIERLRSLAQDYARKIPLTDDEEERRSFIFSEATAFSAADAIEEGLFTEHALRQISSSFKWSTSEANTATNIKDIRKIRFKTPGERLVEHAIALFFDPIKYLSSPIFSLHLFNFPKLDDNSISSAVDETLRALTIDRLKRYVGNLSRLTRPTPLVLYEGRSSMMKSALKLIRMINEDIENAWKANKKAYEAIGGKFTTTLGRSAEIYFDIDFKMPDVVPSREPFEIVEAIIDLFKYPVFNADTEDDMASVIRKLVESFYFKTNDIGGRFIDSDLFDITAIVNLFDRFTQLYDETMENGLAGEQAKLFVSQSQVARDIKELAATLSGGSDTGGTDNFPGPSSSDNSGSSGPADPTGNLDTLSAEQAETVAASQHVSNLTYVGALPSSAFNYAAAIPIVVTNPFVSTSAFTMPCAVAF